MSYLRLLFLPLICAGLLAGGGCASKTKKKDYPEQVVRFSVEAGPREAGSQARLPQSGVTLTVTPKFYFAEFDIQGCEVGTDELGKCLVFSFTEKAARDLYRFTATNQGKRLVTLINGLPVGAKRIDGPLSNGYFVTYVEVPENELEALAKNIKRTSEDARKELEKKQ